MEIEFVIMDGWVVIIDIISVFIDRIFIVEWIGYIIFNVVIIISYI